MVKYWVEDCLLMHGVFQEDLNLRRVLVRHLARFSMMSSVCGRVLRLMMYHAFLGEMQLAMT